MSAETREGELVGSGDGTMMGALLKGAARWSLYAGNCAYVFVRAGLEPPHDQHLCTVHLADVIETSDGVQVWFDARVYGLRGADQSHLHLWTLTMAVQFTTTGQRYQWLNTTLGSSSRNLMSVPGGRSGRGSSQRVMGNSRRCHQIVH